MNKKLYFLLVLILTGNLMFFLANAQETVTTSQNSAETIISQGEITIKSLGVENPGILPTSPFYFLKEWKRGIIKFFTFNPIKKTKLEIEEANERAAEIKKLEEVAPQNIEAVKNAAENYQKNIERLKQRLEVLKDTSENPNVDKLIDKLIDRSIKHQELFDNLEKKFEEAPELKEQLEVNKDKINEIISKVPEKFENMEAFKMRLEEKIENQPEEPFKELRAIEILEKIKEKLPEQEQEKIQDLKENLIKKFKNRIEKLKEAERVKILSPEVLEKLPGDQLKRMEILEEIKERINPEIKEKIERAREEILERKIEKQEIKKEEIEEMIQGVKDLITKVENEMVDLRTEIRRSVEMLLEKSKSHLEATEKSLREGKIGEAFGYVISAKSMVKGAWRQIQDQKEQGQKQQEEEQKNKENNKAKPKIPGNSENIICVQVITSAKNPLTGECREFPTPCDVPQGWEKAERCDVEKQ